MSTLSRQKLMKIIATLGVEEEPVAIAAFLMARKHMRLLNISWSEVAQALASGRPVAAKAPPPPPRNGDVYNAPVYRRPGRKPKAEAEPRPQPAAPRAAEPRPEPVAPWPEARPEPKPELRRTNTKAPEGFRQASWVKQMRRRED